jgi:hypothetical protein
MDILIFQNSRIAALDAKWHDARGRAAKAAAKKRLDIAIKERDRMIAIAGEIYDLSITQQTNGLDEAETAWSNYADAVNAAFDAERIKTEASMAADFLSKNAGLAAQFTDAYGGAVDSGLELVDVLERQQVLNERAIAKQQEILDGKQKEISEQQRLNDLDQQKIDGMRRIDDLRLRESDALSHDLELMSQKETEINDAYQKKIDQLDKVLSINQQIVQSQQDQMSVAQALSQGDIYAAAAAAQQMRANYAANASDNLRTALETGKQNQIDGLLTSGGLTRDQVEARMNSIREQSYQTSLKIRDIEDDIYDRNQKILTLNNEIYDITQKEIVPLQEKNKQYSTLLANYKAEVDYAKSHLIAAGMTAEQWAAAETNHTALIDSIKGATDKVDAYRKAWEAAAEAARAALSAAGVETSATGATGTTAPSGTPDAKQAKLAQARIDLATAEWNKGNYAGARGYLNASKQYVDKANNADITRQYNNFDSVLKSVGFAGGGLVGGMGSGDTVPARLTPGEFVMSKATVKRYGAASMAAMNQNSFRLPKYETDFKNITVDPRSVSSGIANINAPVYNSVQVHVPNSNASPDDIANKVIYKMQQLDRSRIRGTNGR